MEYSVLMSVYVKEKSIYLKGAIESMLNQTVKPNDFVIVCDGPLSDELDRVIDDYCHKHPVLFNIIRLKENVGLARALNEGIVHCKNDIVARMDSDDISLPNRMEKQLKLISEKNIDLISGTVAEFSGDYTNVSEIEDNNALGSKRQLPQEHDDILKFAKKRNPFNHPAIVYKKSKVIECGMYEDYRYFEDYNLWVTMLQNGCRTYNISEDIVYMRAGQSMYKRRGGFNYVKCIFKFKSHLRNTGFISWKMFLIGAFGHAVVSLVPNNVRTFIYSKVLRK